MNIYELTGQFKQLQVMLESGDIDQETFDDTLETLNFTLEEKAENYGLIITNLSGHAEALKAEMIAAGIKDRTKIEPKEL